MRTLVAVLISFTLFTTPSLAADIEVDGFWLRESIPGQPHGAGFGLLKNNTDLDVFLIGGSIEIAEDVEIHQHVMVGQQMRMEQIEALMVPSGSHVQLQPGGYHVMLMNLKEPLIAGDYYSMTLVFSDGTTLDVEVPVKPLIEVKNEHNHH